MRLAGTFATSVNDSCAWCTAVAHKPPGALVMLPDTFCYDVGMARSRKKRPPSGCVPPNRPRISDTAAAEAPSSAAFEPELSSMAFPEEFEFPVQVPCEFANL